MKLTNREIDAARGPLQALISLKFPVAVSFKLARMANRLNEPLRVIDEVKNGLITKHGEPNEAGVMSISGSSPNFGKFVAEYEDLLAIEVEAVIEKVKLPEEVDGKPLEVEPSLLMALEKFVEA